MYEILFALAIALFLGLIFSGVGRRPGPWGSFFTFFIILFLAVWAGGLLMAPVGPAVLGVYWLTFLSVGIIVSLLLASASQTAFIERTKSPSPVYERSVQETNADVIFWALFVALIALVAIAYL